VEGGNSWPPLFISPIETFSIPLLNTIILLSSGVRLTWAHHSLLGGDFYNIIFGVFITICIGIYFTLLQLFEYMERRFCFNDSLYGRIFFLATGFHGIHVIIGTILLRIVFFRGRKNHHYNNHHIGVETASWY
jgi:heme/copper-type cytochrome/quinol oxidase subunit 3